MIKKLRLHAVFLCTVEAAAIFHKLVELRGGVASTYVEFEQSEKLYLVTRDTQSFVERNRCRGREMYSCSARNKLNRSIRFDVSHIRTNGRMAEKYPPR